MLFFEKKIKTKTFSYLSLEKLNQLNIIKLKMLYETLLAGLAIFIFGFYYILSRNKRERIYFHGKHVVITGGSQGIGLDLAVEAFKQGAHVSILARNQQRLNEAKAQIETIKQQNPVLNSQIVQIESIDISKDCDQTKKVFDKVNNLSKKIFFSKCLSNF